MKKRQQKKIFTNVYKSWHQAQLANQSWGLTASENIDQYIYYDKYQLEKLLAIHYQLEIFLVSGWFFIDCTQRKLAVLTARWI